MDSFTQFDGNLLIGIQHALNADWLTPIMKAITLLGEAGIFWIILCLVILQSDHQTDGRQSQTMGYISDGERDAASSGRRIVPERAFSKFHGTGMGIFPGNDARKDGFRQELR